MHILLACRILSKRDEAMQVEFELISISHPVASEFHIPDPDKMAVVGDIGGVKLSAPM